MKTLTAAVLITAITISTNVYAQPAQGAPGMPPPPPGKERREIPPSPPGQLQQVSNFQGKAVKMSSNDDFVFDGFYMLYGTDSLLVKFPAHLGSEVTPVVKNGLTVSVSGVLNVPPSGGKEIRMVSLTANGKTIADAPPAETIAPAETFVKGDGKITSLQTDREGRTNGFIVDNKTILRVPPHIAAQLSTWAKTGSVIVFTGMQKPFMQGEVKSANYSIIHCNTVSVNGQEYLIK